MASIHLAHFLAAVVELKRSRRLPPDAVAERRLRRFRELAVYARERSPYYRRVMQEQTIDPATSTPEQFPVMTKRLLADHLGEIVTDPRLTKEAIHGFLEHSRDPSNRLLGRYVVLHTSGSSGEPGVALFDPRAWARGIASALQRGDVSLIGRRRRVAYLGAVNGHFAGISMTGSVRDWPLRRFFELRPFEVNQPIQRIIDGMNEFKPDIIVGYGSAMRPLADAQLAGRLDIAPMAVSSSGEAILPADLAVIEQAFGRCVSNVYACSELMFLGRQDPGSPSMRLFENDLIFETAADHTLVTNTVNRIMPLIRYRLDDVLVPLEADGERKAFSGIVGRMEQTASFVNSNGREEWFGWHLIAGLMVPGVRRFQMQITGPDSFRLLLELEEGLDATGIEAARRGMDNDVRAALVAKELANVRFSIQVVESIPIDPHSGKFRLIVKAA